MYVMGVALLKHLLSYHAMVVQKKLPAYCTTNYLVVGKLIRVVFILKQIAFAQTSAGS